MVAARLSLRNPRNQFVVQAPQGGHPLHTETAVTLLFQKISRRPPSLSLAGRGKATMVAIRQYWAIVKQEDSRSEKVGRVID